MRRLLIIEIGLGQVALYLLLWLWNEYNASLFSLVFGAIFLFLLVISAIAEFIEPSKVPRWYFGFMAVSVAAPLLAALIYVAINGRPEWMG